MRNFHSITIGKILTMLKGDEKNGILGLLPHLTRSTLNRREVDLGFAKPGRTRRQWRLFDPEKADAFMIAVLEYYDKPLPPDLEESMRTNPRVKEFLDHARRQAIQQEEKRQTVNAQQQSA